MTDTRISDLLMSYYASYSSQWVRMEACVIEAQTDGECLWVGSYLSLINLLRFPPSVILDLDAGVLARASLEIKGMLAVQGDIRSLPFNNRFERVLVPGCVTAYLLDDTDIDRTAASIAGALSKHCVTTLWMDAYGRESILDIDYFNDERELTLLGQPWTLIAQSVRVKAQPYLFDVFLSFTPHHAACAPKKITYRQRAFHPCELVHIFQSHGFEVENCETQKDTGRHNLRLVRNPDQKGILTKNQTPD